MKTDLFNKHYTEQAVKACNDSLKNAYSAIVDIARKRKGSQNVL